MVRPPALNHKSRDPEPCRLANVGLDDISPDAPPPPYSPHHGGRQDVGANTPASCCGCFGMRTGVFAILVCHLALCVFGVIYDWNNMIAPIQSADILLSYIISAITALVYLAMMYAASERKVRMYRRAAMLNVELFVVQAVLSYVTVGVESRGDLVQLGPGLAIAVVTLDVLWFAYWTWVLYKYAHLLEVEAASLQPGNSAATSV